LSILSAISNILPIGRLAAKKGVNKGDDCVPECLEPGYVILDNECVPDPNLSVNTVDIPNEELTELYGGVTMYSYRKGRFNYRGLGRRRGY
jgi:hypothetical protein